MKKAISEKQSQRWREIKSVASGPSILLGITASMGGFLFGADTGQISGFLIMEVCPIIN
jgi:MFS transporter, SP family, sugar:H+ symporter